MKPRDTLAGLALTFNMRPQQIKQFNGLYNDFLIPGQLLYLKNPKSLSSTPDIQDFREARSNSSKNRLRSGSWGPGNPENNKMNNSSNNNELAGTLRPISEILKGAENSVENFLQASAVHTPPSTPTETREEHKDNKENNKDMNNSESGWTMLGNSGVNQSSSEEAKGSSEDG